MNYKVVFDNLTTDNAAWHFAAFGLIFMAIGAGMTAHTGHAMESFCVSGACFRE